VVWLGIRDGAESLANIHTELAARLHPLGFAAERRPFSAHLTIGRVKSARAGLRPRDIRRQWNDFPAEAGECRLRAVTLFRSRLSPRGAAYEALVRVPLQ
jgi:2'-5' RNA ligase